MIDTVAISHKIATFCLNNPDMAIRVEKIDFNLVSILKQNRHDNSAVIGVSQEEVPCFFSECLRHCKEFSTSGLLSVEQSESPERFTISKQLR